MYSKLFGSIINSSVWSEDSDTCKVWISMIAMADQRGFVFGSSSGLARICAMPVEKVEEVLDKFLSPDKRSSDLSRSPENEGRRIAVVDGGWRLVNWDHYNAVASAEDRRRQDREHKRKVRAAIGQEAVMLQSYESGLTEEDLSASVGKRLQTSALRGRGSSDSDTDTGEGERGAAAPRPPAKGWKSPEAEEVVQFFEGRESTKKEAMRFLAYYDSNGWKVGKNPMKSWRAAAAGWLMREANR